MCKEGNVLQCELFLENVVKLACSVELNNPERMKQPYCWNNEATERACYIRMLKGRPHTDESLIASH